MPTDTELIAAVAEKLGWEEQTFPSIPGVAWTAPDGMVYAAGKLPSTDACLRLLDKTLDEFDEAYRSIVTRYASGTVEVEIKRTKPRKSWLTFDDNNRPRAILLALLEVE